MKERHIFKLIILFLMVFSFSVFADTSAIRNEMTQAVYTDYDLASVESVSNDTFSLGVVNDSGVFSINNDDNNFLSYLGNYQRQEISVEIINDEMIRKVKYHSDKLLYCLYEETYTKNHYNKWGLRIINKSVVKQ